MRSAFGIIYTSAICSCLWLLLLQMLLPLWQQGEAMPWWRHNDASYDASLDPLVWSRAFVQDTVRRPRISRQPAIPQLGKHRASWRRSKPHLNSNNNNNYRKYVRRHRKLLLMRQTSC